MRVSDVMTAPAVCVHRDTPVSEAAEVLACYGFAVLPVVDGDRRLVGVVGEAIAQDVRRRLTARRAAR